MGSGGYGHLGGCEQVLKIYFHFSFHLCFLSTWKHWIHHVFMCFVDHMPLLFFAKKKNYDFMAHFIHLPPALISFTIKLLYRIQVLGRQMP